MSEKETGGAAFPLDTNNEVQGCTNTGMTLRDYFAAKAMHARLRNFGPHWHNDDAEVEECMRMTAKRAYQVADAMLEARKS